MAIQRSPPLIISCCLLLCFCVEVSSLVYQDLEDLGVSCHPADTCKGINLDVRQEDRSCDCDISCARHGTCCIDSKYKSEKRRTSEVCTFIPSLNASIFMVSKCHPLWDGPNRTKELCEGYSLSNAVKIIPVTSLSSGLTYANVFCSMCNKEKDNVSRWDFSVTRQEFFYDNLRQCVGAFPRTLEHSDVLGNWTWGYWLEYAPHLKRFIDVDLNVDIPKDLTAVVRQCLPDVVSKCAENWTDRDVMKECEAFMAAIEVPSQDESFGLAGRTTYRNAHCARCNYVKNFNNSTCKQMLRISGGTKVKSSKYRNVLLHFPHRLPSDICVAHLAGVDTVSNTTGCETIVCDPGYKITEGRCEPAFISFMNEVDEARHHVVSHHIGTPMFIKQTPDT